MKFPVVYKQLKLILKMWEKSQDENREMMMTEIKNSMKEIEENSYYDED